MGKMIRYGTTVSSSKTTAIAKQVYERLPLLTIRTLTARNLRSTFMSLPGILISYSYLCLSFWGASPVGVDDSSNNRLGRLFFLFLQAPAPLS